MKNLVAIAVVISGVCFACGSTSRVAVAYDRAIWTGSGGNNHVQNPLNWSWPDGGWNPGYPGDDTTVILDHTAENTTLDFSETVWFNADTVTIGNGIDTVAYNIVSYPEIRRWTTSWANGFTVNDKATVGFKNIRLDGLALLSGSTLRVEEDGHLLVGGLLDLNGNLEWVLPSVPSGEYVVAEYGTLDGEFESVIGLPSGWRIEYGSREDDYIRAVPEPATWVLAALGLLGFLAYAWQLRPHVA